MNNTGKAYDLYWRLYNKNTEFKKLIDEGMRNHTIRFFEDEEWDKIKAQNFISPDPRMKEFIDMFLLGFNIGNCGGTSLQLSYSYDDVDRVTGILPFLKGTLNAPNGGHQWLETKTHIIDTSLMLVIDKSLKSKFGYKEEVRIPSYKLNSDPRYQSRKEFTNDRSIRRK